ncbi:hypothetical protein SDC9_110507 [bioreactor metagenome]|uniref:Uncharacterized protein n=1 Tax=bioreactor metagenome TaxID=1076179 RepID=A0A645BET9_9ZZZZ
MEGQVGTKRRHVDAESAKAGVGGGQLVQVFPQGTGQLINGLLVGVGAAVQHVISNPGVAVLVLTLIGPSGNNAVAEGAAGGLVELLKHVFGNVNQMHGNLAGQLCDGGVANAHAVEGGVEGLVPQAVHGAAGGNLKNLEVLRRFAHSVDNQPVSGRGDGRGRVNVQLFAHQIVQCLDVGVRAGDLMAVFNGIQADQAQVFEALVLKALLHGIGLG